jgi:hypothetical protein
MTTPHVADELPRLLTGEATRADVLAAAAHLRGCVDCQQELVSAVVAHASLSSAQRFAPELLALHAEQLLSETDASAAEVPDEDLPDLAAVFAQVRAEADTAPGPASASVPVPPAESRRAGRGRLAVAAAAAGLLVGGGAVGAVTQLGGSGPSGRAVALAAYDTGTHAATARMGASTLTVDATALPTLDSRHRYEVWLTNAARTQMQPVGWIGADGKARLTVPSDLSDEFDAIEVSVQQVNAPSYDYSGTSVLRGSYRNS